MIILDFLIFNLTAWYEVRIDRLKWSTPLERASYVIGMVTMLWMFSIYEIYDIFIYKVVVFNYQLVPFVVVGFGSTQLYKYIYVSKGRYERLVASQTNPFKIGIKTGGVLSIVFVFISFLITCGIVVIFTK